MSKNSTILEKTFLSRQFISALPGKIKNKHDFDAAHSFL